MNQHLLHTNAWSISAVCLQFGTRFSLQKSLDFYVKLSAFSAYENDTWQQHNKITQSSLSPKRSWEGLCKKAANFSDMKLLLYILLASLHFLTFTICFAAKILVKINIHNWNFALAANNHQRLVGNRSWAKLSGVEKLAKIQKCSKLFWCLVILWKLANSFVPKTIIRTSPWKLASIFAGFMRFCAMIFKARLSN